ncbi:hypothetical protein ACFPRL_24885 [Pseudoclavibacter helvolus]
MSEPSSARLGVAAAKMHSADECGFVSSRSSTVTRWRVTRRPARRSADCQKAASRRSPAACSVAVAMHPCWPFF